jgi:2-methylcitrate dehydratase PrpD
MGEDDLVRESQQLADFVASATFSDVPADVIERMKLYLLDTLAAGFAGSRQPWSRIVYDAERDRGSSGPCSVLGSPATMAPASAALVNGTMTGAFELEHSGHLAHPGGTVPPAALAAAEAAGASGRDVLLACVLGYEVACRIGEAQTRAVEDQRGFHNPAANGPFSSAAAVGKIIGLDPERQLSAFGIAGSMSGGLAEFAWNGAMTKRLHIGLANRAGLEAAYLARRGFTGPETVLEGPFGYLHAFSPAPKPGWLVADLGRRWMSRDMKIKPYAAHGVLQSVIAALQEFKATHPVSPAEISSVRIRAASTARMLEKRFVSAAPQTLLQAQLSLPFMVAVTLFRDMSDPLALDEPALTDAGIVRLASAVTWEKIDTDDPELAYLEITESGTTHEVEARDYPGSDTMPARWDDVADKFRRCSQRVLAPEQQQRVISTVQSFGTLPNAGELMTLVRSAD